MANAIKAAIGSADAPPVLRANLAVRELRSDEFRSGMKIEGKPKVVALGVLWAFTGGDVDVDFGAGPAVIRMSSYDSYTEPYDPASNPYRGLAILFDSGGSFDWGDNVDAGHWDAASSSCSIDIGSSSIGGIDGGVYLPSTTLRMRGNNASLCATNPVVARRFAVQESGRVMGTRPAAAAGATRFSIHLVE